MRSKKRNGYRNTKAGLDENEHGFNYEEVDIWNIYKTQRLCLTLRYLVRFPPPTTHKTLLLILLREALQHMLRL